MSRILIYAFGLLTILGAVSVGLLAQDPSTNKAGAPAAATAANAEQQGIDTLRSTFVTAYNGGQADAISATFAEDCRITDQEGDTVEGRASIKQRYVDTFKSNPGATIVLRSASLRFLTPDVALEEGEAIVVDPDKLTDPKASAPGSGLPYSTIYVKRDGRWLQSAVREHPQPAAPQQAPHEKLQALKWMVGDWVEEGPDAFSTSTCQWDESGNFLVWRYRVQNKNANAGGGTTFIGWDPLTKQIMSWVFDYEGGHGEATWSQLADDQWMVKASGVLIDGRTATATQYIKRLGPDRASWTSVDRVAGGEPVPNISEYTLVRRPPQAKSSGVEKKQ
jgi:uncharacterized protein (TIGR02246 family)